MQSENTEVQTKYQSVCSDREQTSNKQTYAISVYLTQSKANQFMQLCYIDK